MKAKRYAVGETVTFPVHLYETGKITHVTNGPSGQAQYHIQTKDGKVWLLAHQTIRASNLPPRGD